VSFILGLDGGATKTSVMILDTDSDKIFESLSGSTNYKAIGIKVTEDNIVKPVLDLVQIIEGSTNQKNIRFESSCLGFSGCDLDSDVEIYKKIIFKSKLKSFLDPDKTIICNDTKIGLAAGSNSKNRVMLICGTGSNCFGINEFGKEGNANGWDYILGDEGSSYSIAIKALRAVMKAFDGRGEKTIISGNVLELLNLKSELELFEWVYKKTTSKKDISSIACIVCQAANKGDKISINILKEECDEVKITVSTIINKLGLKDKNFDLVLVGSVFKCEKYFKNILLNSLKKEFKKINFKQLVKKPVEGAIKLALEKSNNKSI